jgi:hypothetical protein
MFVLSKEKIILWKNFHEFKVILDSYNFIYILIDF